MSFIDTIKKNKHKSEVNKDLHSGEVYDLWSHLVSRYDVLKKTQIFYSFAHDIEFKIMIKKGLEILEGQIEELEQIMIKYGLVLPDRPPAAPPTTNNLPLFTDEMIYKEILNAIGQFIDTHVRTFRFMWNDDLRPLFIKYIKMELDIYDKWMKYGKLKGWINIPPSSQL